MSVFDAFARLEKERKEKEGTGGILPVTHIVAGLGNPGGEYLYTRHNAGFLAMDYISHEKGVFPLEKLKFRSLTADTVIAGKRVLLMKPQTFMNLSGEAVREAAAFYKIPPENILILSDDIYLAPGRLRFREKGSDGGHNGLKNIIYQLNTDAFPRLRIGVGVKPKEYDIVDYVLGKLPEEEMTLMRERHGDILKGVEKWLAGDTEAAIRICNAGIPKKE